MKLTYQYRLYPTPPQERALNETLYQCKRLWNLVHDKHDWTRQTQQRGASPKEQYEAFKMERQWDTGIEGLPYDTATWMIKKYYAALKAYRSKRKQDDRARAPGRIKGHESLSTIPYRFGRQDMRLDAITIVKQQQVKEIKCAEGTILEQCHNQKWARLMVKNVGDIRLRYHRPLPDGSKVTYAEISKTTESKWYVQFSVNIPDKPVIHDGDVVGVDVGLVYALALSDGTTYEPPKFYRGQLRRLRILQRQFTRRMIANNPANYNRDGTTKKGAIIWRYSNRMRETKRLIGVVFARIARQRKDWLHNITDELTRRYSVIILEGLDLTFMLKNKRLALSAHDVSLGRLRTILEYKATLRGVQIVYVPAAYTSQACSMCGCVNRDNRQTQARFHCQECGYEDNADFNAAQNIKKSGLLLLQGVGSTASGT